MYVIHLCTCIHRVYTGRVVKQKNYNNKRQELCDGSFPCVRREPWRLSYGRQRVTRTLKR